MPRVARCQVCSVSLPAVQRRDTRYCGSTCRVRASRARRKGRPSPDDLRRRWAWSKTPTETRSWVLLWYRRLAHSPLRALAAKHRETQALHAQLADAQAAIRQQATELATVRQQLAAQAAEAARSAASTIEQQRQIQADLTTARQSVTAQRECATDLERQLANAVRQRDLARHDARNLRCERDTAQQHVCRTEAIVEKLQQTLSLTRRETDAHQDALRRARRRNVRLRRKLVQVRTVSSQRALLAHALHQRLLRVRQRALQTQTEHAQALRVAHDRIAEQTQSIHTLQSERDDARGMQQVHQVSVNFLSSLLQSASKHADDTNAKLKEARKTQGDLAAALQSASDEAKRAQQALDSYKSTTEAELHALRAHRDRTEDPLPEIEELKRQIVQLDIRKGHAEYQRDESKKVLKIRTDLYKYYDWCNSRRILDLQNQIRELGGVPRETVIEEPPPPDYQGGTGAPSDPEPNRSDARGPRRR